MSEAFTSSTLILAAEIGLGLTVLSLMILGLLFLRRRRRTAQVQTLNVLAKKRTNEHIAVLKDSLQSVWQHDPDALATRLNRVAKLQTELYRVVMGMLADQREQNPERLRKAAESLVEAGRDLVPVGTGGKLPGDLRQKILDIAKQNRNLHGVLAKREEDLEILRTEVETRAVERQLVEQNLVEQNLSAADRVAAERIERMRNEIAARDKQIVVLRQELDEVRNVLGQTEAEIDRVTGEYTKLYAKIHGKQG